jgi:DNA-directed RNA polymerase subunit omega
VRLYLATDRDGMARITVEDCEKIVKNRFDLVILAAQRARQIFAGDRITIEEDDDKDEKKPVIALREIAEGTVSPEILKEKAIEKFRTVMEDEESDENFEELMAEDTYSPYIGIEMKAADAAAGITVINERDLDKYDEMGDPGVV